MPLQKAKDIRVRFYIPKTGAHYGKRKSKNRNKRKIEDKNQAKEMTAFVLDEEELKNLRRDILENPEKY